MIWRRRISWGVLMGFLAAIALTLPSTLSFDPAYGAQRARATRAAPAVKRTTPARPAKRRAAPATAISKDAAMVVDGASGRVLYSRNADEPRYPASLTKMMTLYLLFEQLDRGKYKLDSQFTTSTHAAAQFPTKLGLKPGEQIPVEIAIQAVAVLSANDAAVVVAEALGGTESNFAALMTDKARALGMMNTTYQNASGLPDRQQLTTAADMALLGRHLAYDFPQYYRYFATPSFSFNKRVYNTHDHLLDGFDGTDGIKTGYTRASGFNLVSSVVRNNRHVVGVVMGGVSVPARDREMMRLLSDAFELAQSDPRVLVEANAPWHGGKGPAVSPFKLLPSSPRQITTTVVASAARPDRGVTVNMLSDGSDASRSRDTRVATLVPPLPQSAPVQPLVVAQGDVADPPLSDTGAALKQWVIQIGAFASATLAEAQLASYASAVDVVGQAKRYVVPFESVDGQTLYRARFGLFAEAEARDICRRMTQRGQTCFATQQLN